MLQHHIPHIGRYEIKSLIGAGGMGRLYLARDTNPNTYRLVALKLLNAQIDSTELRERFGREARSLAALSHANVVNIYDAGEHDEAPYIVMEYVRGETVAEKIARKAPLTMRQKLKFVIDLCRGLAHAHEAGLIHRDIKPANLMVDQDGRLKLLDFGIARSEEGMTRFGPQVTQANVRIGTPGYMSPEQIDSGEIDARSDLFAVGTVLYELVAYHEAFSGNTTRQIENKVLHSQPAPLSSLVPDLDPALEHVVDKALAKSPADRYQSAEQFAAALERVRRQFGVAESAPAVRSTPSPGNNSGQKSHGWLAEIAYQRGCACLQEGARDAARRYCIEALAEDLGHEAARTLLHQLDPRARVITPPPREITPLPLPPTVVSPAGPGSCEPTAFGTHARSENAVADARTVVAGRVAGRRPVRTKAPWQIPPQWKRFAPVAAALAILIAVVAAGAWWALTPGSTVMTLTVTKPAGGTISAGAIRCGTAASDCSATLPQGASVEFQVEADTGFRFAGFTGDCAPGGRTLMNSARTCGARFEEDVALTGKTDVELLTIAPPAGGTVVAEGITCGTQGKACSTNRPRGSHLQLVATADKGFTFLGFTGDCTQSGGAHMIGPRTCGATFVAAGTTKKLASVPTQPETRSSTSAGAGLRTTQTAVENDGERVSAPKVPPATASAEVARKEIEELLERYRAAYAARNFEGVQRAFPTVHRAIEGQFKQLRSLTYVFHGAPKYVHLDAFAGTARIEIGSTMTTENSSGGKQAPRDWVEQIDLQKRGADNQWVISSMSRQQK